MRYKKGALYGNLSTIRQENKLIRGTNIGRFMTQKLIFVFILICSIIILHVKENIVTYDSYFARIPSFAKSVYVWDMSTYGTLFNALLPTTQVILMNAV